MVVELTSLIGLRVLIVDDEAMIASHLQQLLESAGGVVVGPVYNLEKAIDAAQREQLGGAVLDVNLRPDQLPHC